MHSTRSETSDLDEDIASTPLTPEDVERPTDPDDERNR